MGTGCSITCRNCGHQETHFLGVGMAYFPLSNVLDSVIPKRQRPKVRELLKTVGEDSADYSHELFVCPRCETLHQRFYLKIAKDDELLFETKFRCGKCRQSLERASLERMHEYRCSNLNASKITPLF